MWKRTGVLPKGRVHKRNLAFARIPEIFVDILEWLGGEG